MYINVFLHSIRVCTCVYEIGIHVWVSSNVWVQTVTQLSLSKMKSCSSHMRKDAWDCAVILDLRWWWDIAMWQEEKRWEWRGRDIACLQLGNCSRKAKPLLETVIEHMMRRQGTSHARSEKKLSDWKGRMHTHATCVGPPHPHEQCGCNPILLWIRFKALWMSLNVPESNQQNLYESKIIAPVKHPCIKAEAAPQFFVLLLCACPAIKDNCEKGKHSLKIKFKWIRKAKVTVAKHWREIGCSLSYWNVILWFPFWRRILKFSTRDLFETKADVASVKTRAAKCVISGNNGISQICPSPRRREQCWRQTDRESFLLEKMQKMTM